MFSKFHFSPLTTLLLVSAITLDCKNNKYQLRNIGRFETNRLILEPTTDADFNILAEYLMNPEVTRYLDPSLIDKVFLTKEEALEFLNKKAENQTIEFTIKLKDNGLPIGIIDAMIFENNLVMFGYWLGKEFQKKGYAREAAYGFCNKVFNAEDVETCYISCLEKNCSSWNLAKDIIDYLQNHNPNVKTKKELETFNFDVKGRKINIHTIQLKKI